MELAGNWSYPTAVRFGAGRIAEIGEAVQSAGISRPLFVTDAGLANMDITHRTLGLLGDAGLASEVFAEIRPNPLEANLLAGIEVYGEGDHDGVVAFGGGSALDVGKLIAFMAGQVLPVWEFEDIGANWTRADAETIAPVVAVPTTAGTGSEVGRAGVVTHAATHSKKVIFHPQMMPAQVICDPELTIGMPARITAGTGMDALAHCLEAYCSPSFHPFSQGIAVEGVRLVAGALERAVAEGVDIEARSQMMAAAAMGATAFQKGLGAIHSLSHPVGALYDTHHGLTNAVFMPYVLEFNRASIEDKISRLAAYVDLSEASFDAFMRFVLDLRSTIGIPHTLAELGVDDARADEIAEMAVMDPTASGNPIGLNVAGAREIFAAAYSGSLRV